MGIDINAVNVSVNGDLNISGLRCEKKRKDILGLLIYLFHNDKNINHFNILPKIILLREKEQKCNNTQISALNIAYDIRGGIGESSVKIEMNHVENIGKEDISAIYYYTGIDFGIPSVVMIKEKNGFCKLDCKMQEIKNSNDIKLYEYGLHSRLKRGNNIENIQLEMAYNDAFDLSQQEIINFYPLNYGKKIKRVSYRIRIFEKNDFVIDLRKIFKAKKGFDETVVERKSGDRRNDYVEYIFNISDVDMSNIYYFTLNKK